MPPRVFIVVLLFVRVKLPTLSRFLAVALLGFLAGYSLRGVLGPLVPRPADSISALVAHLERHGIPLRVIPIAHNGDVCRGAYLTRTSKDWDQLVMWGRMPGHLPHWQGTAHVQPLPGPQARLEAQLSWGEACLMSGQLLLFGDPVLLTQFRAALRQ
jgi:hypothetical protein